MNRMHFIVFYLIFFFATSDGTSMLLSTAIRLNKVLVSYPIGVISERDLRVCHEGSACNIIHKRFWLPPMIERLCRCPHRNECPWTLIDNDNKTIYLNNRSQMKFCTSLSALPNCSQKKPAITIIKPSENFGDKLSSKNHSALHNDRHKRHSEYKNITISCNCQEPHYWKLKTNTTKTDNDKNLLHQTYYCSKVDKMCNAFRNKVR